MLEKVKVKFKYGQKQPSTWHSEQTVKEFALSSIIGLNKVNK